MWFKVENKRSSAGQKFVIRCNSEVGGTAISEERQAKGVDAARKTAELLASSLNVPATVYGTDSDGEFVLGVYEVSDDGAAIATSPLIKKLFAESAAANLTFKDQLLADIPEETIKGFASLSAALGYIVTQHKQVKRSTAPQISYSTLFRIFCGGGDASTLSLPANDATIAILTRKLSEMPAWVWLKELIIPHQQVRSELDFIAESIRNREMLKAEGLTIKAWAPAFRPAWRRQIDGH